MVPLQLLVASALVWTGEPSGVVLEFTAENWCKPCQAMSPIVSKLQRQGYPIRKIDVDRDKATPARYGVNSYPTFVLVIDGQEVDRKSGMMPEENLKQFCARIPKPVERAPQQSARVKANEVDLGAEGQLPQSVPAQKPPENRKPPILGIFNRKRNEPPAVAPDAARAQNEEHTFSALSRQPATPLAATVRLRVKDAGGNLDVGTGTIIDSRPEQTLILTCGHIFRQWSQGSKVYVDLFDGEKTFEIVGKLVKYELDDKKGLDIGLVSISTTQPLPACRIAASGTGIIKGASVVSVGCGGGELPTVQKQMITAINRYKTNDIECSALPEGGRSGGGLFDRSGRVIGICMCADPKYREGIYADLKAIQTFLSKQGLARVYGGEPVVNDEPQLAGGNDGDVQIANDDGQDADLGEPAEVRARRPAKRQTVEVATAEEGSAPLSLPSVSREDVEGSEVMIIINSKGKNGAPSKIVRLHRASKGFWDNLLPEIDPREALQETTLKSAPREPAQRPAARRQARRPATIDLQPNTGSVASFEDSPNEPRPFRRQRSTMSEELIGATR